MPQTDLQILGQLRERRFDEATREKSRKDREHEQARQALLAANKAAEDARVSAAKEVERLYAELLHKEICSVADVEAVRLREAMLRERIAKLEKDAKDAELAVQKAAEAAEQARAKMVAANAAKEAIALLSAEVAKKLRIEQERKEDDIIDELATVQSVMRNRQ